MDFPRRYFFQAFDLPASNGDFQQKAGRNSRLVRSPNKVKLKLFGE
jgi:hypothetical protein